jgi:hypothetical protein
MGNFHFDTGSARHERSLLDQSSHYTEGIVEGTVSFIEH